MNNSNAIFKNLSENSFLGGKGELSAPPIKSWPEWFILFAGSILMLAGASNLLEAFGHLQVLDLQDPILGIQIRYFLLIVGMTKLIVSYCCLFTKKASVSLGLVAWLPVNFLIYRIGVWTMGWPHPWISVGRLTDLFNLSPQFADGLVLVTNLYLLIGASAVFWFERRMGLVSSFKKMSCPACGGHIKFSIQNVGQIMPCPHCQKTITLRKSENIKISCFFCKEHIEFPAHAIGKKLPCPHCKMDIILKEAGIL